MQWLVSYDIADDGRRRRLAETLLDYGERVQESVFWLDAEDGLEDRIRERMARIIRTEEDSLWVVPLCLACARKIEVSGVSPKPELPEYYIY